MLLLVLALSLVAPVAMQRPSDIVKWSASVREAPATPGGTVKVTVVANIERGWKLYALTQPEGGPQKLAIGVAAGAPFTVSPRQIVGPRPKTLDDANFAMRTQYYESSAEFTVPLTLAKTVPTGKQQIPFEITFQACGESLCLRPFTQKLSAEITVAR